MTKLIALIGPILLFFALQAQARTIALELGESTKIGSTQITCGQQTGMGSCNAYGCSKCGICNAYGCPKCDSGNAGGTCNAYGCWDGAKGECNAYGCSQNGKCNAYGCSENGECNAYGCP